MLCPVDSPWCRLASASASSLVPRSADSDADAARFFGDDIAALSIRAPTTEESQLTLQRGQLHPSDPRDEHKYDWVTRRHADIWAELRRRSHGGGGAELVTCMGALQSRWSFGHCEQ